MLEILCFRPAMPSRVVSPAAAARVMLRLYVTLSAIIGAFLPISAVAQQAPSPPREPTSYERSIAAGYKALMLCGAVFNGGRSQADAEALELTGIYPDYDAIVPTLKASVSRAVTIPRDDGQPQVWAGTVTVPYDEKLPPRIAEWSHESGCTILPLGSTREPLEGLTLFGGFDDFPGSLDAQPWPMGEKGIDARPTPALVAPIARAFDGAYKGRTTGVVIVKDGRIVGERYATGFGPHSTQRTWSVAKSIAGSLIGIAAREKLLDPQQKLMPDRQDMRGGITLDHAMRMATGLHTATAGNRTDALYFGGTTVEEELAYWLPEALPGTRFRYANNDIVFAVRALRQALKDDARYAAFARTELFARLGMTRTVAEVDSGGNYVLSSQVFSSARDFARLGMFWLADGVWNGERILPEGWMKYMTTPGGPQPATGPGYGATMWLFGPAQGLPEGSYAAQGNRGQFIVVVPSRNLVVVRRGEDAAGAAFDVAKFTADVVAALP
jgi:CubicO group peptidase (beta-lactamase class C family)